MFQQHEVTWESKIHFIEFELLFFGGHESIIRQADRPDMLTLVGRFVACVVKEVASKKMMPRHESRVGFVKNIFCKSRSGRSL